MELFAGHADVSFMANQYGLTALEPFDLLYGHDMTKNKCKRSWREAQARFNPLLAMVETECTEWVIFNENLKDRMEELEAKRQQQLPLVREGVATCFRQIETGNFFLFAYGGCDSKGNLILKTYQWLTNSEEIAHALSKKLTKEEQEYCTPLQGKEVRASARYPVNMCRAILRALKVEARRRWPQRFIKSHEVLYQEPVQDPAAWADVLREIRRIFDTTTSKTLTLSDGDAVHQQISQLVPWQLIRVQIVRTPIQRRLPRDIL